MNTVNQEDFYENLFSSYSIDYLSKEPEGIQKEKIKFAVENKDEAFTVFKDYYNTNFGSINEDGNLVSIHTGGWSDNESMIYEFKKTMWWQSYFVLNIVGGHYYFDTEKYKGEKEWDVVKKPSSPLSQETVSKDLERAVKLLKDYEQWEADLIADNAFWWPQAPKDAISGKTYDAMLELQQRRNEFINSLTPIQNNEQ